MRFGAFLAAASTLALCLGIAACGDGGGGSSPGVTPTPTASPTPTSSPSPTPTPVDRWSSVKAELDRFGVANAAIIVGSRTGGVRLRYEKGTFRLSDTKLVASASKMMAGLIILKMIEDGQMSLSDNPQRYLPYWTTSAADPRSRITLAQLLAFTSGFNQSETGNNCVTDPNTTLQACAQSYYVQGITTAPGTTFVYGNGHLQIAGAMAEVAGGKAFSQLFRDKVAAPLALGPISGITQPSATNPNVAGGGISTGEEYAKILDGALGGRLLSNLAPFQNDQTMGVTFLFRPQAATATGDWHYAAASWRECDDPAFGPACAAAKLISSPGKFGWTP